LEKDIKSFLKRPSEEGVMSRASDVMQKLGVVVHHNYTEQENDVPTRVSKYNESVAGAYLAFLREALPTITDDDTIMANVTDPQWTCPTCASEFIAPSNVEALQCPGCYQSAELARGEVPYRTLSGNMKRADGETGKAQYV
jgi:hypothetical protein